MSDNAVMTRAQRAALKQAQNDLRAALDDARMRRVLMRIVDGTGVFQRSFTGNSETFYREGRRSVGLEIIEMVEQVEPDAFIALQVEMAKLRKKDKDTHYEDEDHD